MRTMLVRLMAVGFVSLAPGFLAGDLPDALPFAPGGSDINIQQDKIVRLAPGQPARLPGLVTPVHGAPRQDTRVTMEWHDRELVLRFTCSDEKIVMRQLPPAAPDARGEDVVEIFLDRGHGHDHVFTTTNWVYIIVNAAGAAQSARLPPPGWTPEKSPRGGWTTASLPGLQVHAATNASGWNVEIRLPWESLAGPPAAGEIWGFNVSRSDQPAGEYSSCSPTWGDFFHIDQWGHLVFAENAADWPAIRRDIRTAHARLARQRVLDSLLGGRADWRQPGPTWIEIGGEIYGARPDKRGPLGGGPGYAAVITNGDHVAATPEALLAALQRARPGETVFIPGDATLDFSVPVLVDGLVIGLPGGVTLASDRGADGSPGALICSSTFKTAPLCNCLGPGVRLAGLRLRGPDPHARIDWHDGCQKLHPDDRSRRYYAFPTSEGIRTTHPGLTVENCDLAGWSHAAIYLLNGGGHHVHHNYIHHNQREGLGYGVCLDRAEALIENNVFDYNRHSIAGTGRPESGYEARHNLEYGHALNHCFDMHGGRDRKDGSEIAGGWLKIHHNAFRAPTQPVRIRGIPQQEAVIHHNWFLRTRPPPEGAAAGPAQADGRARVFNNAHGMLAPRVLDPDQATGGETSK